MIMAENSSVPFKTLIINQKTHWKLFCIDLVLLLFSWGGYYKCKFGHVDALFDAINPEVSKGARIGCFRWAGYLVDMFAWKKLHFLASEHYRLSLLLMLVFMALSLWIVQLTFLPLFQDKIKDALGATAFIASSALIFINVLDSELFYYTESFSIFKFSFLFCSLGCYLLTRKRYISGTMCFAVMTCFYQICCALAAILLAFWLFMKHEGKMSKSLFLQEAVAICTPMLLGALNYLTGPAVLHWLYRFNMFYMPEKSIKTEDFPVILTRWIYQLREIFQSNMNLTAGIYMPLLLTTITLVMMILVFAGRYEWSRVGTLFLVTGISLLVFSAIPIADGGYSSPRMVFPFYGIESGLLLSVLYFISPPDSNREKGGFCDYLRKLACVGAGLFLLLQMFFIQNIISNRMLSNTLDMIYAENVLKIITEYETETGSEVKYISPAPDADFKKHYEEVYYKREAVNERLYGTSAYSLIEYISRPERHFEKKEMDSKTYKELFQNKNWTGFDKEQVVIRGDTAYICVF